MAKTAKIKVKKTVIRNTPKGKITIQSSFNNTIITLSDQIGNALTWASAGSCGFKGTKKATPYAAQTAMRYVLNKAQEFQMFYCDITVSGVGSGRDAALRVLSGSNLTVGSIKDITPIAHNGARPKKPRRV